MKSKNLFILLLIFIFPYLVNGETLDTPISLGYGDSIPQGSYIFTSPAYFYLINGQPAYCMDQHTPNPNKLNQVEVYYVTEGGSFTNGLIAMMNYNLSQNYNAGLYDAIRVYTASSAFAKGNKGNGNVITENDDLGSGRHVARVKQYLDVANAAYNGDRTYLPSSTSSSDVSEDSFSLEVIDDSNINNIRVRINFNSTKPSGFKMTSKCTTSDSNVSCSIKSTLDSNNEFIISLSGKSKSTNNVTVKFNFSSGSSSEKMYDKVYIYTCIGDENECDQKKYGVSQFGFQRFLTVDGDLVDSNGSGFTKEIKVTVPGICDDPNLSDDEKLKNGCCDQIDGSKYPDDSKEQDTYIKYCGPIVHMENDCGKDSCEDNSYKAFSHSYVRLRNMKYILEDLQKGGSADDYIDRSINNYCGIYTTEKLDILTPATAASVSGQFFVFDSYNNNNYSNINSYFRQPYVVERVKASFFFSYNKWKSNYDSSISAENNAYSDWQTAVNNVKSSYDAWQREISSKNYFENIKNLWLNPGNDAPYVVCKTGTKSYNQDICTNRKNQAISQFNNASVAEENAKNNYNNAITAEKNAKNAYRNAVQKRTDLQNQRDTCISESNSFKSSYNFNLDGNIPNVDFTYSQNSQKEGNKSYTISMVNNDSPVKYWPNVTTNSSNTNYLGDKSIANNQTTNISRGGYMLNADNNELISYSFPNSFIDGCSGAKCNTYNYDGYIYSSIQAQTDASDPYGENITITSPETISKIYYFRPPNNTFALMNSGEYKTLNYESNAAHTTVNGLEIGYVYNIELTSYKGSYETSFAVSNYGYKTNSGRYLIQELLKKFNKLKDFNLDGNLTSKCTYCNMEMAFKRNCDICDPNTTYDFEPQFYYRSISLSDVTPTDREVETNWTDTKGTEAKKQIELGSGLASTTSDDSNNNYIAIATENYNKNHGNISTYLADSSTVGKHDIYDDTSREYLEYEVTLTSKDLQSIKRNSSRTYFNYANMNMCTGSSVINSKDSDTQYCYTCNNDMKECESSFITSYFSDTSGRNKWKYYVNGTFCTGNIKSCIKDLEYTEDGKYPDPLFTKQYLERYKNWP